MPKPAISPASASAALFFIIAAFAQELWQPPIGLNPNATKAYVRYAHSEPAGTSQELANRKSRQAEDSRKIAKDLAKSCKKGKRCWVLVEDPSQADVVVEWKLKRDYLPLEERERKGITGGVATEWYWYKTKLVLPDGTEMEESEWIKCPNDWYGSWTSDCGYKEGGLQIIWLGTRLDDYVNRTKTK